MTLRKKLEKDGVRHPRISAAIMYLSYMNKKKGINISNIKTKINIKSLAKLNDNRFQAFVDVLIKTSFN